MTDSRYTVESFSAPTCDGGGAQYAVIDTERTAEQGRTAHSGALYYVTRDQALADRWCAELNAKLEDQAAQIRRQRRADALLRCQRLSFSPPEEVTRHVTAELVAGDHTEALKIENGWCTREVSIPGLTVTVTCGADATSGTDRCADHQPVMADVVLIERAQ